MGTETAVEWKKDKRNHHWYSPKRHRWLCWCLTCGLLALKNPVSIKAADRPCPGGES